MVCDNTLPTLLQCFAHFVTMLPTLSQYFAHFVTMLCRLCYNALPKILLEKNRNLFNSIPQNYTNKFNKNISKVQKKILNTKNVHDKNKINPFHEIPIQNTSYYFQKRFTIYFNIFIAFLYWVLSVTQAPKYPLKIPLFMCRRK